MKYYTYIHYTEDTHEPFYIGKGTLDSKRAWNFRASATRGRNQYWKRKVDKHGFTYEIAARWITEKEALDHEIFLISVFRDLGYKLCNLTDGGEGLTGYEMPEAQRQKIADRLKGNKHTLGRKLSPEQVQRISDLHKGKPKTEEHRKNLSEARKGIKVPSIWKPIHCATTNTTYPSLSAAAEATGADPSHIVKCCRGKLKKTKGMEFSYVNPAPMEDARLAA